ncbi:OmpA family protein [bacterium]|nr:OmpA family protein [bacterium]
MAKKKPPEEHINLERWLVSYGDFMTLLLATFVVLYALSQIDISEFIKLEDSIKKAFNAPSLIEGSESILDGSESIFDNKSADSVIEPLMLEYVSQRYESNAFSQIKESINELKKNGDIEGVDVKITETGLLITFKDDLLFYSASATLTSKALKALDEIGTLINEQFALHMIRVEGHTDSQPINNIMFPSNWELSTARSSSIIRYFLARFKFAPGIFTAVGYGDTRPIADNKTEKNREKNRRVEIMILKNKYKEFEHPSINSFIKQSKTVQKNFQKDRLENIERIKEENIELKKLKVRSSLIDDNADVNDVKKKNNRILNRYKKSIKNDNSKDSGTKENSSHGLYDDTTKNILKNNLDEEFGLTKEK